MAKKNKPNPPPKPKPPPKPRPAPKPKPKPKPKPAPKPKKKVAVKKKGKLRAKKTGNKRIIASNKKKKRTLKKKKKGLRSKHAKGNRKHRGKRLRGESKPRGKRKKRPGNDKTSIADRAYEKYLKKMYLPDESIISTYDMSNVVRERFKKTVRFENEMPALFLKVRVMAQGIDGSVANDVSVERFVPGAFSARLIVQNNGNKDVYLNKGGVALFNINGGVLEKDEHVETVSLPSKEMRTGESAIDIGGVWVQSQDQAKSLGQWIITNQADGGEVYELELFGNPYIDLNDVVVIEYGDKGLDDAMRFVVTSIKHSFNNGFSTKISVRKIWPNSGRSFVHRTGVPQNPLLL